MRSSEIILIGILPFPLDILHSYSVEATTDPAFDPIPEQQRDISKFLKELEQAHCSGWDETQVREDLIRQIEKERRELKRWLNEQRDGTP